MQSDVDDEEHVAVVVISPLQHVVVGAEHLIVQESVGVRCRWLSNFTDIVFQPQSHVVEWNVNE